MLRLSALSVSALVFSGACCFGQVDRSYSSKAIAQGTAVFITIETVCAPIMQVDMPALQEMQRMSYRDGGDYFGAEYFQPLVEKELRAIMKGVKKAGAFAWCSEQKGFFRQNGSSVFP